MATAVKDDVKKRRSSQSRARTRLGGDSSIYVTIFVALIAVGLTLGPILFLGLGGFRTNGQIAEDPTGLPNPWVWQNYWDILTGSTFWEFTLNSAIISIATTAGVVLFGTMAAYPLARYSFRGREGVFLMFTAGLMFPLTVAIFPLFLLLQDLGLGGMWGLIIPQIAFALPVTVIIMRPFLAALPDELEEASFMDGLTRVGFFFRMVLPLARPGMVTVGVLAFLGSWNAYLLPLVMLTGRDAPTTLPLGVTQFQGQNAANFAGIMAYTFLAMIPALVFFLMMEKRIVDGLSGAVKG
ncbi:carbohydrate ABC transporter permease [Demequina muriae]|uniref:Carbohydrate ABC transporter permease n=1 Tax=Demequina muriae TaxID=3051664 RepID=A0ABT8GIF4_9MICO|nr:carbohydrate ABC transporter permease [Demequina sp. EGI L300058]MDN4481217.1 carbohydrate ABC transporter permease [Demequina sp. EGI L300058]